MNLMGFMQTQLSLSFMLQSKIIVASVSQAVTVAAAATVAACAGLVNVQLVGA